MKDQRVEPPDYNEYGKCDFCQDEFHIDDLHELDRLKEIYICYQCDGEREGKSDEELLQEVGGLTTHAADGARFCPECKALLEEHSVYCDNCGTDTPRR